ncbi:hypothetical protein [[Eubacterium] hominis]|uniref:hypothetical protein n=1 Tax=[Eubacterium] hominis TaxID=2764325 RepID=UPI003A4DFA28
MKEPCYNITVTDMERRIILNALSMLKTHQIEAKKNYDCIDDLILKACDAPLSKGKNKRDYETR